MHNPFYDNNLKMVTDLYRHEHNLQLTIEKTYNHRINRNFYDKPQIKILEVFLEQTRNHWDESGLRILLRMVLRSFLLGSL